MNPHGVVQGRSVLVRYNPRWQMRQGQLTPPIPGGKAEFDTYGQLTAGPYGLGMYHGPNRFFREYRRNFLVAGCIDSLAYWSTKAGFDTALEPQGIEFSDDDAGQQAEAAYIKKYAGLKEYVDQQNINVELQDVAGIAIIMAKIFGHHGFEYDYDDSGQFERWVSVDPDQILPVNNRKKQRMGYSYKGRGNTVAAPFFQPDEVFYLVNKDLDGRGYGISDVEAVLREVQLDDKLVSEDLTEAATTMWAPQILLWLDTTQIPITWKDADIQASLDSMVQAMAPGKITAGDSRFTAQIVDIQPNTDRLINISQAMLQRILGNWRTPKYMLGLEQTAYARATAITEFQSYVEGPVAIAQHWLGRQIEKQWYALLTELWLTKNDPTWNEGDPYPILVKHVWRQITVEDLATLVTAAAAMYAQGTGFADQAKAYEFMQKGTECDWDPKQLIAKQLAVSKAAQEFSGQEQMTHNPIDPNAPTSTVKAPPGAATQPTGAPPQPGDNPQPPKGKGNVAIVTPELSPM
jgi:hypothetical protein